MDTSTPTAAKPGRGGTLDILRFAAAFFVVVFHYGGEAPVTLDKLHPVFLRGYLATDFFLMLSGYVLGRAYGRSVDEARVGPLEFLSRRVARIWPAHLIVLAMMVLCVLITHEAGFNPHHAGRFEWSDLLPQTLLVQAWGDVGGWGWNIPTWSLSALLVCYAVFPGVWGLLARARLPGMIVAALAAVGMTDLAAHLALHRGLFDLPFYLGVARALPLFFTGMVLARWVERAPLAKPLAIGLGSAAGLGLIALQLMGRFDPLSVGLIALIVLCAGSVPVTRPMPWAEQAGKLSFSLFITHILVSTLWFGVLHVAGDSGLPAWARWAVWAGALPAALVGAWIFDRLIDQPLQARIAPWLARAFKPRPGRYPAPAPNA